VTKGFASLSHVALCDMRCPGARWRLAFWSAVTATVAGFRLAWHDRSQAWLSPTPDSGRAGMTQTLLAIGTVIAASEGPVA
jgi:hypothetical protein